MDIAQLYSIDNLFIEVKCGDKWTADQIPDLIEALGFVKRKDKSSNSKVRVEFTSYKDKETFPIRSSSLYSIGSLDFFQVNGYLFVTEGKSFLGADLRNNSGFSLLHSSFWQKPLYLKASLLIIGFILLLWRYGFYELHAAGLAKEGKGLLLVGPSGSGKSSLALSLVRQGWHYLSDDMLILRHTSSGVEALPLRRYFKVERSLVSKYPELTRLLNKPLEFLNEEAYIYIDGVYPHQSVQRCIPRTIIFPRITKRGKSRIAPIKQSEAFINMFGSNCYGMYFDKQIVRQRLEIIKELIYQAECYQMSVGLDLYKDPNKILELLPWS
jgi:hypothetical protein